MWNYIKLMRLEFFISYLFRKKFFLRRNDLLKLKLDVKLFVFFNIIYCCRSYLFFLFYGFKVRIEFYRR